ncbi:MAG: sterol-binding protein, partial [Mesorhizobium sp.]
MGVQEIADRIRSRVAGAGFEHSVKFDTGSD